MKETDKERAEIVGNVDTDIDIDIDRPGHLRKKL
jgi:hypothetical protein